MVHPPWRGRRGPSSPRAGGVLLLATLVVLVVAGLCAGYLQISTAITRREASSLNDKQAFYIAEAGLSEAWAGLTIGKTGNVGTAREPAVFGEGLFWVEATRNADGTITLQSTGMYRNGKAVLSIVAEPGETSVAELGLFSDSELDLGPGTRVDAYDSRDGYPAPPFGERGTRPDTGA